MDESWLTSVGIDIGTSTTKMIASRLRLGRTSGTFALPRYEIVERKLIYMSPIVPTPLRSEDEIDPEAIFRLLMREYENAGLRMEDIKSGAVIITGETATKKNAQHIVHMLAEKAGDFVVATAGADLEGVLAGKGSGAEERSKRMRGVVANVDIGGGTANTAFFSRGRCIGTVTFHIGGRLIRLDESGLIRYVSPHLKRWLEARGYVLAPGERTTFAELSDIAARLAGEMLDYLRGGAADAGFRALILGSEPQALPKIDEIMISGGVGQMMSGPPPADLKQTAVYGDFGPVLAAALARLAETSPLPFVPPAQAARATVIGAGMQSTEISGATVHFDALLLPIRNVPVLPLELEAEDLVSGDAARARVAAVLETGMRLFDPAAQPPFALAVKGLRYCTYAQLQMIAEALSSEYRARFSGAKLLCVVCENDMAKALGQALALRCGNDLQLLCIDQIRVEHGDYIDFGEPISGTMIPVVIKTLAFN